MKHNLSPGNRPLGSPARHRIGKALAAIEAENPKPKGILEKRYARVQLPDGKLRELVDLISTIGFGELLKPRTHFLTKDRA